MRLGVSYKGETTIKRNVEPLVSVCGPRVTQFQPAHEMFPSFARRGPQPERAIDVHPRPVLMSNRDQRLKLVIRASVDVTGLQKNNRRRFRIFRELRRESARDEPAAVVDWKIDDVRTAQAEQSHRAFKRSVPQTAR